MKSIDVEITHEQLSQGITIGCAVTVSADEGLIKSHVLEIHITAPKSSELETIGDKAAQDFRDRYP